MIKSIGNSESISSNFDNLMSNLANKNAPTEINQTSEKVSKQNNDEFQKTFEPSKIESEISKLLEDDSLIAQFSTEFFGCLINGFKVVHQNGHFMKTCTFFQQSVGV